jgi:two-component sensor histidine kinase
MTAIRGRDGRVTGISKVLRDITERISFENQLKASLQEKEVLLREIHHRVKNNLQVISSLLNLQVSKEASPTTRRGLLESQSRIQSMALVHQLLYESRDLGHIDFTEYLRTLAVRLLGTYNVGPQRIDVRVEGEPLLLEIDRAISCGLIVNELVANAIEHAFPDERRGHISINVQRDGAQVVLTVRDDGVGIPPQLTLEHVQSFGLQIARTLTMQIDGKIDVRREAGTFVQIMFPAAVRRSGQSALDAA